MKQKILFTLAVISVLVFTAYQLNIQLFKVDAESEINSLRDSDENEFEEEEKEKDPGWHQEWFDSRKNEDGVIPRGLRNKWYAHDKLVKSQTSSLKSSNTTNVQELGPFDVGGRTRAILVDQSNSDRIFAGGVSGGLWRSTDGGSTWTAINDQSASIAVSCITQNPLNNNVIYYGTGEGYDGGSAGIPGGGIYRSTNGGNSFSLLTNTDNSNFDYITSIANSRTQSNTVVAGTEENGLWRTTDGGVNWSRVRNTSRRIDEVLALPDGNFFVSISNDGIYRSTDDGASFTKLTSGLPASSGIDRVEIAFCLSKPDTLYAAFAESNDVTEGVYRTNNGGDSWTEVTLPDSETKFTWYCYMIGVDPSDGEKVVMGAQNAYYSDDGGSSWSTLNTGHADNHVVAIDEKTPNTFYIGNDGGIYGKSWNSLSTAATDLNDGYHVTQFYGGDYYPTGDNFVGGTQDNGTNRRLNDAQKFILWGDGGYAQVSLQDGNLGYVESQNGNIRRSTNMQATNPTFTGISGDITDNDHFIAPFEINRADGQQVYFCSKTRIWRTIDRGDSWTAISGSHSEMKAIGVRNAANPTIYYGGSNGNIYRLDNARTNSAANEMDLSASVPNAVTNHFISDIKPHPTDNTIVYVTFSSTDDDPRVYRVNDIDTQSPNWTSIHGNLPQSLPCNSMEVDPDDDQNLFVGTDFGLYSSWDGGNTWIKETDIPNVPVLQVQRRVSDKKLFVFTHGRGVFSAEVGNATGGGGCPSTVTSFPYIESFESATSMWSPITTPSTCTGEWAKRTGSTTSSRTGPSAANDGTFYLYTESSNPCYNREMTVESPCFDLSGLSNPEITFDYHMYGADMGSLSLRVSTDQGATWTALWSINGQQHTSNAAWTTAIVSLAAYAGQTIKLSIRGVTGDGYRSDMAIDNINISQLNCTALITSFPYNESFESTTSSWSPITTSTGCTGDWARDASGTGSWGTGPSAANDGTFYLYTESSSSCRNREMIVESPCFDLSGLSNPQLTFDYHMYGSNMGDLFLEVSTDGLSWANLSTISGQQQTSNTAAWATEAVPLSAYTNERIKLRFRGVTGTNYKSDMAIDNINILQPDANNCVSAFPYTEGFENGLGLWTQDTGDNINWTRKTGNTPSNSTGPSSASEGSYYMYTEASGSNANKTANLVSPCFDLSNLNNPLLTFKYHMYGADIGSLTVEASTDNGATWNLLSGTFGERGNSWRSNSLTNINLYVSQPVRLRFRGVTGNGYRSDIAIDDVKITSSANNKEVTDTSIDYIGIESSADKQSTDTSIGAHNYPNPFSKQTTIEFDLPEDAPVTLFIADMTGKKVAVILDGEQRHTGAHQVTFDGSAYPAGMYYYTIQAGEYITTKKMILAK